MNSALPERSTLGKKPNGQDAEKAVGAQVGVNGINVLKDTDIGVFRNQGGRDKSAYTKTTKPDGTVVEKVKIDRKSKNKGLVDVGTQGINIGDIGVDAAISPEASEDAVSFVDSIWGSKTAAGKTQDARMKKLEMQEAEAAKLEQFKATREQQHQTDALDRQKAQQLQAAPVQELDEGARTI